MYLADHKLRETILLSLYVASVYIYVYTHIYTFKINESIKVKIVIDIV